MSPNENDSGRIETLPDGSISIPIYAEELVVTRRTILCAVARQLALVSIVCGLSALLVDTYLY